MKEEVMKEALQRRKGNGLDLTIIIGKPEDSKNPDMQELAPDVNDANPGMQQVDEASDELNTKAAQVDHPDEDQDKELIREMLGEDDQGAVEENTSSIIGKARALMRAKLKK